MDEITRSLQKTVLEDKKLLYIDVLNFSGYFFKIENHWSFKHANKKVKNFVNFAKNSNFKLKVFIDAFIETDETILKWKKRREDEVIKGVRKMPQGMNVLLGDLFRKNGVGVCYSMEADNDDTIASHAQNDNAYILSQDSDFLRYNDYKYIIYSNFKLDYKSRKLILIKRTNIFCKKSKRNIIIPPPKTRSTDPGFITLPKYYLRGTPSPLTHYFENLHITIRPLRQAYYYHININSNVIEEFPTFKDSKVEWDIKYVNKNGSLLKLLGKPIEAYNYFFKNIVKPNDVDKKIWENHIYATYAVVFEICSMYMNKPLYELLVDYAKI